MNSFHRILLAVILTASLVDIYSQDYAIYSSLLSDYVREGKVEYRNLCTDPRLELVVQSLRNVNDDTLKNNSDKLAFWINVYNVYTLKIVCENYPVESIVDIGWGGIIVGHILGTSVWNKKFVDTGNKKLSLNYIEHEIIRKKFNDPQIHFALVCASESCPSLLNEAYRGDKLDEQLQMQASKFLNDKTKNRFDLKNRIAYLSSIFDWYLNDFVSDEKELLVYIAKYLPNDIKKDISANSGIWRIKYLDYDWSLNDLKKN